MCKLSIITINLNNKEGLERTIRSVIEQSFSDYEFIIVDGHSEDRSTILRNKYSNNITYFISEKDSGIYNAMNKGVKLATGKYCLFLNSGDSLYEKDTLLNVFNAKHDEDILYGDMIIENSNGERSVGVMPLHLDLSHMIRDTLWHPVSFIKRTLFNSIGYYDESFKIAGDYHFFFRAVLIDQVSSFHLSQIISVFSTSGISSKHENQQLIAKERRRVQRQFFTEKEIRKHEDISDWKRFKNNLRRWIK